MTMRAFIRLYRKEIDQHINAALGKEGRWPRRNDDERHIWVINDEGLYLWAQQEGVKV
jgi:hypothetical protein